MQIGDNLAFGGYDWRVLDIKDNATLIITEEIIEKRPYHHVYSDTTWAECELRKYLNGEFYDRFSVNDQARIMKVTNKNPNNPWYGTKGGEDTQDNIFLLTIEDAVCKYFGDSSALLQNRGNRKYWFGRKDENNIKRKATFDGYPSWWWLRSPGRINRAAVYIHGDPVGCVGINGNSVLARHFGPERQGGVRPALWLKLES